MKSYCAWTRRSAISKAESTISWRLDAPFPCGSDGNVWSTVSTNLRTASIALAASDPGVHGLVERPGEPGQAPAFHRVDGTLRRLRHRCDVLRTGAAPRLGRDRLVVHVCRWDRIKDPIGVMRGFADYTLPHAQAHLILAGPTVHTVTDDPEAPGVLDEVQAAWRALAHQQRCRVTIACLPMHDVEENAAIVNALQRHADVIVKKSLVACRDV
jgi:trehalose synthase